MVVLVTCKNEEDLIKHEGARVLTTFLQFQVYENFSRCSRAANSAICSRIGPKFELLQDFIAVPLSCKNEKDTIKNKKANRIIHRFFRRSRAANSTVSSGIRPTFNLIQAFMVFLVIYKNEEDPIKHEGARVLTKFLPLYVYGKRNHEF